MTTLQTENAITIRCATSGKKRVRYYNGMLLDQKDLEGEQQYQSFQRQELTRLMLGCGIAEGLRVSVTSDQCMLQIEPGIALDGKGHWIRVESRIDIRVTELCSSSGETRCCGSTESDRLVPDKAYCLVLRYHEKPHEPRPSIEKHKPGCEPACEYGRTSEGYCLVLLDDERCCAPLACCTAGEGASRDELGAALRALCFDDLKPPTNGCCDVVLGRIRVDCEKRTIALDDEKDGPFRRYAWTARRLDRLMAALCAATARVKTDREQPPTPITDAPADPNALRGAPTGRRRPQTPAQPTDG